MHSQVFPKFFACLNAFLKMLLTRNLYSYIRIEGIMVVGLTDSYGDELHVTTFCNLSEN